MLLNRVILMKMGSREEQKEEVGRDTKGASASRAFPMVSDVFPGGNGEVCQTKRISSPCSVSGEAQQGCRTGAALRKVVFGQSQAKWTLLQNLPLLWQHTVAVNELKKLFPHTQKSLSTPPKCSKGTSALSEGQLERQEILQRVTLEVSYTAWHPHIPQSQRRERSSFLSTVT